MKKYILCLTIFLLIISCISIDENSIAENVKTARKFKNKEIRIAKEKDSVIEHQEIDSNKLNENNDFKISKETIENLEKNLEEPTTPQIITKIEYIEKEKIVEVPVQEFINNNVSGVKNLNAKSKLLKANNYNATMGLSKGNFNNAEVVYNFAKGYIYPVHVTIPNVTCIELEENENFISYFLGDQTSFQIYNEVVNNKVVIYVCGIVDNAATNLIINTNRRRYLINLKENCNLMNVVKWNYGIDLSKNVYTGKTLSSSEREDLNYKYKNNLRNASFYNDFENFILVKDDYNQKGFSENYVTEEKKFYVRNNDLVTAGLLENLNHNYKIKYKTRRNFKPKWFPEFVFSDGFKTYIFIPNLANSPIRPVIFATDKRGKKFNVVNYRINGLYYIIDSIDKYYILTSEIEDKSETVFIEKKW